MDPRANVHLRRALFGNSLEKKANRVKNIYKFIHFIASHSEERKTNVIGVLFAKYSSKASNVYLHTKDEITCANQVSV